MRFFSEKYRFLTALGFVLSAGFVAVSAINYIEARSNLEKAISEQILPVTGDAIQSGLQKELQRPVVIASAMAQDIFVRDWILNGEAGMEQLMRYLKENTQQHGAVSSFLVSERTGQYFAADGTARVVQQSDARDAWYFRVRDLKAPHEILVAADPENRNATRITVHHRIADYSGNFLGVVGVIVSTDAIAELIDRYQARFDRSVYLTDTQGNIMVAGKSVPATPTKLQNRPGIGPVAPQILSADSKPIQVTYRVDDTEMMVNARLLPEFGWHLVVEKNVSRQLQPIREALMLALALAAATVVFALAILVFVIARDQKRMERMASIDPLTGLLNRQAFEIVLEQSMLDVKRSGQPISAILFDIDSFQQVNDQHGHVAGDQILRTIAQLARGVVRDNDIITRWSGTEFLILLRECPLEIAVGVAEKLRSAISSHDFGLSSPPQTITTSLGVAQFGFEESQISFFIRADKALRDAKAAGRNRTIASVMQNQGENIAASIARRG